MGESHYDPARHHRRSIRLPGHDYAGGGLYFVTICAHRRAGDIFAPPEVKAMVERVWEGIAGAGKEGTHKGRPYVALPNSKYRAIGNPALLHVEKIGMLCSRDCPAEVLAAACKRAAGATREHCFISGFHSPPEKTILAALLASEARVICCPAWGIDEMRIPPEWLPALEANRMMILEIGTHGGDLASSRERNAFVITRATQLWLPHVSPHGMLARQLAEL
jgi:hypothetical protein